MIFINKELNKKNMAKGIKLNTNEFIRRAKMVHGEDKYDYLPTEYINMKTNLKILCKNCEKIFEQRPNYHLKAIGCPICRNGYNKVGKDNFIERANLKHFDKYDYTKVEYTNVDTKVEIICKEHGSFFQTPYKHMLGQKCPKCVPNHKDTTESFINKAKKVHGDRFDYSLVNFISSNIDVNIVCKKHGVFKQSPNSHLRGSGCIKCNKEIQSINQSSNIDEFVSKSILKHGEKYDYSLVEYKNAETKVKIRCPKHDYIFEQIPNSHLRGSGCYFCGRETLAEAQSMTTEDFINRANVIHNYKYDYTEVEYKNSSTKVKIICNIHGIFSQVPNSHLNGCGCKKCGTIFSTNYHRENPSGWHYHIWIKAGMRSKVFTGFKVYIIKCFDKDSGEIFYKIGKTFKEITKRFIKSTIPYDFEIIKVFEGDGRQISELEVLLQNMNKQYSYLPKKEFNGMYECFTDLLNEVLNYELK